jgi:hypothetical protein
MNKYAAFALIALCVSIGGAQERQTCSLTYILKSVVYIDCGYDKQIAVGDTLTIFHAGNEIGTIIVTAVSRLSSAARIIEQRVPFVAGDRAVEHRLANKETAAIISPVMPDSVSQSAINNRFMPNRKPVSGENIISGRASVQYSNILAEDSRFNLSQPAAAIRLDIRNLMGTGMQFTMNERSIFDASDLYALYGKQSGLKNRLYEFSLQRDTPYAIVGFGAGRLVSRYVGGMGAFDGAQVYYRYDNFTTGVLGGAQVVDRSLALDQEGTKGSIFVNYHTGPDIFHQYDGTVAYGRQMKNARLDREFLYLQHGLSLGPDLSLYESSEIELNDIANGVRSSAFKLSNTFLIVHYTPMEIVSTNIGYDAARSVYLFESMKLIPDSLFDRNLFQGFRADVSVRLPYLITVSANARLGTKTGESKNSQMLGGDIRMIDVLVIDMNAAVRYGKITGPYSTASDFTFDVDRTFFRDLTATVRVNYYRMTVSTVLQTFTTLTLGGDVYYRISPMWFASLGGEYLIDNTMNSLRVVTELGIRF